jgi:hypothetical protein
MRWMKLQNDWFDFDNVVRLRKTESFSPIVPKIGHKVTVFYRILVDDFILSFNSEEERDEVWDNLIIGLGIYD